jgi:hypothetical protein
MYYKQFSDAQDCYKELMRSLDDAKVDVNKKLLIQKETQKTLVKLSFTIKPDSANQISCLCNYIIIKLTERFVRY